MKNLEKLEGLREALITHPEQHNQGCFYTNYDSSPVTDCGTSACAAGWTIALEGLTAKSAQKDSDKSLSTIAREILGLSSREATDLFFDTLDEDDPETAAIKLIDVYISEAMKERDNER